MLVLVTTIVEGADKLKYNKDIRPILSENCFACHGPDSAARKADLRLDKREDAIKFGAIVAGSAEKSPIIERIYSTEKDKVMPSPKSHKVLTAIQKKDSSNGWSKVRNTNSIGLSSQQKPTLPQIKTKHGRRIPSIDSSLLNLKRKASPCPRSRQANPCKKIKSRP